MKKKRTCKPLGFQRLVVKDGGGRHLSPIKNGGGVHPVARLRIKKRNDAECSAAERKGGKKKVDDLFFGAKCVWLVEAAAAARGRVRVYCV